MRAFTITLFLMMFFLSLSVFNQAGIFTSQVEAPDVASHINSTYSGMNASVSSVGGGADTFGFLTLWSYVQAFWNIVKDFFGYVLFIYPFLTNELGAPQVVASAVQSVVYLLYMITFFEFVTQRRLE